MYYSFFPTKFEVDGCGTDVALHSLFLKKSFPYLPDGNVVAEKFWIFSYEVLHTGGHEQLFSIRVFLHTLNFCFDSLL